MPFEPDRWWVVPAHPGEIEADQWVSIDDERARAAIERFALAEARPEVGEAYLLRRWVHDGIETIAEEGDQRFALTAAALAFLRDR